MPHHRDRPALRAHESLSRPLRHWLAYLACGLGLATIQAAALQTSAALAAATLSWSTPVTIDSGHALGAIACPSRGLCVAVDGEGRVLASVAPTAGASGWKQVESDSSHALTSVSCASAELCAAVDNAGRVLVSNDPAAAGTWTARSIDGTTALTSISCPTESLCVAVDQLGKALVSETPVSGAQPWGSATIDAGHSLEAVSCASAHLCVAVDDAGNALASGQPAGGAASWSARDVDSAHPLLGVSCEMAGACVAVDGYGNALASADPASLAPTWSSTGIDPGAVGGTGVPAGMSCASSGLCLAVDGSEAARASDDPADPVPAWNVSHVGVALHAVSCAPEGLCVATSTGGRVLSGSVPAPEVTTGSPVEVAQTTAKLAGTVDPNDALLSDCRFEYGTSTAYSQSVPCSPQSGSGSVAQAVSVSIAGLEPGTLYHYRVVALTGAGEGIGADETFTTVTATLVHPRPSISGVPAVGSRLQCNPGVPVGEAVTLAYAWWRDGAPIPGASGSAYRVARADATHHIQCQVTATNAAGSATGHSAFVAVPRQGIVAAAGETIVGRAFARHGRVSLLIRCSTRAPRGCAIALRLSASLRDRHRRLVSVSVGSNSARLARGRRAVLSVWLNARGRRLLAHTKHLTVQLSVTGTVIGVLNASLSRQQVTFRA